MRDYTPPPIKLTQTLECFCKTKSDKKLIIFGSGTEADRFIKKHLLLDEIAYIVDNNVSKQGAKLYDSIPICSPECLKKENPKDVVILVAIIDYNDLVKQCKRINKKFVIFCSTKLKENLYFDENVLNEDAFSKNFFIRNEFAKLLCKIKMKQKNKVIIYNIDSAFRNAGVGIADMLRGIVGAYDMSKRLKTDFKINITYPHNINNYLIPNKYNWKINEKEWQTYKSKTSLFRWFDSLELNYPEMFLRNYDNLFITCNTGRKTLNYSQIFTELFKPSAELQEFIDYNTNKIGRDYISATARFMQLLGDFKEGNFPKLKSRQEREKLIRKCLEDLKEIHNENKDKKILVTSDSITFLNEAKKLDFVYVINGKREHIAYSKTISKDVLMNSFVDYFMLTVSKKIYSIVEGEMYESGFPFTASLHNTNYYKISQKYGYGA